MATKVEFHSSLTSITNLVELSDMTNEATAPRTHTNPLSDSSNKAGDPSNPLIVGEPNKFGRSFKPMTLVSELKPRLSPKPFSKEPSLEFLGIRKPIMTPKPQSLTKSSIKEKPEEQKQTSKEFHGSASLIKKNNGSENDSRTSVEQVSFKNAFFAKPEPNKHLETAGITRSKSLRDNQGRKSDLKPIGSLHAKEWKLHNKFEVFLNPSPISKNAEEIHSNEALGSLKSRESSLDSEMTNDKEKSILFTENAASEVQTSAEVQPKRRRRPVSELFLSLPEDKKPGNLEYKEVESQLISVDKPLIRNPRPLSMDASSIFESKSSVQFVPILSENKEQINVFSSSEIGSAETPTPIVPKQENAFHSSVKAFAAVKLSRTDSKRKDQDDEFKLTKKNLVDFDKNNSPTTNITKNRNYMSDHKHKSDAVKSEQDVKMPLKDPAFEKIKAIKSDKDNVSKLTFLEQGKIVCAVDSENVTENLKNEGNIIPGGTVRNRIGLLFSVSNSPSACSELQSGENESNGTSIQQRIKELAIENSDVKSVNARRSLPARPLSADLTKLFLGQGMGNDRTFEKPLEKKSARSEEVQPEGHIPDNEKNEDDRAHSDASSLEGIQWKRYEFATGDENEKPLMKKGNISGQRRSFSFRSKLTLSPSNSYEEPVKHTFSSESDSLKTVRATLFDHKVERHNAADALSVTDTVFMTSSSMAVRKPEVLDLSSHERTAEIKKELEAKMHLREEYYRQFDSSEVGHERLKAEKSVSCNVEKKTLTLDLPDNRTFNDYDKKPIHEENANCQRVEPRYEIIQTIGERVLSESIAVAVEDKAVTLRSRKSSVNRKNSIKNEVNIPSQDMSLRFGNVSHQFKGDAPTSEAENRLESTKEKSIFASEHNNAGGSTILESSFLKTVDKQPEVVGVLQENFKDELDIKSTKINSRKSWISGYEMNYSNDFITDNHQRTELITMAKGESRVFGLKQYPDSGKINKNINILTNDYKEANSLYPPVEEKVRKHSGSISDLKMSERWRRKSAPQEVFNQFKEPESTLHSTSRQTDKSDSFFPQKAGTKNIKEMKPFMEANVPSQSVSSSENNSNNSVDAMATCYAVTGQVRDFRNEFSSGNHQKEICKVALGQDEPVSGISDDCAVKRKSRPLHSATVLKLHYNNDVSSDKYPSEKLAKEENNDLSGRSMHGVPNKKTNLDDDNRRRRARNKSTGSMKENVNDVDSFGKEKKEKYNINAEENIPQHSDTHRHPVQKNTPKVVQKDPFESKTYAFKVEPTERYRSSVLDIDAIMADYIPGHSQVNEILDKQSKLMKEQKTPQREKSKSLRVKNDTPRRNSKDQVETSLSGPSFKSFAETNTRVKIDMPSPENNPVVDSFVADFGSAQRYRGTDVSAWDKKVGSDMCSGSHIEGRGKAISEWSDKGRDGIKRPCADVSKYENPAAVILKSDPSWDYTAPREATDNRAQETSVKHTFNMKSDGNKTVHVDRSSLVNTNNRDSLMTLKHDLIKFKNSLSEYSSDLKQSTADYKHRENVRDSTSQQEDERRNEQQKVRRSLPPDYTENHVEKRRSFRQRASSDLQKDTENERIGHSHRRLDSKVITHVTNHKRSRSLHREREEDLQLDQLKQSFSRTTPAQKDTDTLVQEADSQYGTWSGEHQSQDSFSHGSPLSENVSSTRKPRVSSSSSHLELDSQDATPEQRTASLDRSSVDMDSIDGIVLPPSVRSCPEEGELDFSFMDEPSVLDSSALKNRVQLSRRNHRRAPTLHTQRRSKSRLSDSQFAVIEESDSTWMFKDTTEEKPEKEEESEDEKEKTPKSTGQPQRLPVFPGMDPSVLKAQLRKRPESDGHTEASSTAHVYKSPKSSAQHGALGGRPLPSAAEKEDRTVEMSPQWLQELKSKKRLSQYENNS